MPELTLIQPSRPNRTVEAETNWELTRPFSLFYLAAAMKSRSDWAVRILDLEKSFYASMSLDQVLEGASSRLYGITATTYTRFQALEVIKMIRIMHPKSLIVVGGVHFGNCPEDSLQHVPEIDVVVRGEGEKTLGQIADAVAQGSDFSGIRGISYRQGSLVINNPDQGSFEDLDSLPLNKMFSWADYPESLFGNSDHIPAISIMSSRGCPYQCIFCSKRGTHYRVRRAQKVVDEIEDLVRRFPNVKAINFLDLTLTAKTDHVLSLCRELQDRRLGVAWWCESRANLPLHLIPEMSRAGCVSVALGVESGSPRILANLKKNITIDQVRTFCKASQEVGIKVQCYFMYSHPGETEEDVHLTLDLMLELDEFATCTIQPAMIFPGTELEQMARSRGVLPEGFSWSEPYISEFNIELGQLPNCPIYVEGLSREFMKSVPALLANMRYLKFMAMRKIEVESQYVSLYEEMTWGQILRKMYKRFVVNRQPLPEYLTVSCLMRYCVNRIFKRRTKHADEVGK